MSKLTTLVFLVRENNVLLAMKKRGFGSGKWNGIGGKLEAGESLEQALLRECQEEIGVTPRVYTKVAEHDFHEFHNGQPARMNVYVYLCTKWDGEPAESEEMAPRWFDKGEIPYDDMWPDDPYWLPQVLAGAHLKSVFELDQLDNVVRQTVTEVTEF